MVIMRDPNKCKCPFCGSILVQNEDGFCHRCLEWIPDPPFKRMPALGF